MESRQKIIPAGVAAALLVVMVLVGCMFSTGYRMVNGRVADKMYSPACVSSLHVVADNVPVMTTNVKLEQFTLLIVVDGRAETCIVPADTCTKTAIGEIVPMYCNAYLCRVIEE